MKLHHLGFIVKDIDMYQTKMIYESKLYDIIDPIQNARLSLYKNYSDSFIELIEPLNENAYTWNSMHKKGNHFNHFCYRVKNFAVVNLYEEKHQLLKILGPIPSKLFNEKEVCFYYTRNKHIVEFLIDK